MLLRDLTAGIKGVCRAYDEAVWTIDIHEVKDDSRVVAEGDVFVALKGENQDGHTFLDQAVENGASVVMIENKDYIREGIPWILVKDSREVYGIMKQALVGKPSTKLSVIGITGTNGKTTVAHMLTAILEEAGKSVGLMGTISNRIAGVETKAELTTPGSAELAELFAQMAAAQADYVVMEVSSHALDQSRTAGIEFDLAIFTNLSQDHLDYHGTQSAYLHAKAKLFSGLNPQGVKSRKKAAVLNADDAASEILADYCRVPVITYGVSELCYLRAEDIQLASSGIRYKLVYGTQQYPLSLKLNGRFNVYNSLAAISAALIEGIEIQVIIRALEKMQPVRGRFQQVEDEGHILPYTIYIDFAHTPDGLEQCISTARELCNGRILTVFGCGGHRDSTKRPLMGEVAARLSDIVVVTSDNPRDEEPMAIIEDILQGVGSPSASAEVLIEADRAAAIRLAASRASEGDVILICGKGHEDYQIIGQEKRPFDDYQEAQKLMIRGS